VLNQVDAIGLRTLKCCQPAINKPPHAPVQLRQCCGVQLKHAGSKSLQLAGRRADSWLWYVCRASLQGYSRGAFQERLQQFGRRDEEETAAAAAAAGGGRWAGAVPAAALLLPRFFRACAAAGRCNAYIRCASHTQRSPCIFHAGDRRTPPRSKHTVQEFSFKTSAFFGSKINVHASIPRLVTEDYVRGKFPKGLPRSAEPAAPAPQPQLPLPGRLDVTPPRGAAPSPPPASPGRLDGSSAIASAPPAKRRAASGRLEAQPLAAELSAEPRPLLGRLVRPPAPAAECWEAPARGQTAAAVEHASSTARSRISIAAPAREALPATPAAVPQLSSEAGATAEPAEAGTAVVRPAAPACGHEAHLASEQVVPVANRAAAAAAAAAVAPRRSRVNAGCQAARESGWRAGSGQATAADVPAPPAPAAAVAESHLDLATLLAAWPSPAGGADVGPAQGAGGSLRRTFAPSPRRPAARPPAVPLLGCGAAQEAGEALPFGEVSNLVSPAAEAPGSFQVAQLKAASTGGSRRSGGGSTRSGGRSGGGKRGSSDSGASDSSGRGGSEAGASLPPRPRHASASQIRPQALSAAAPDISSRSCSSSSMPLPCDLPPRPSSRGTQPIPLATAPTGEQNDGSAGSVKQQPQQPAQAPFAPQPVGQAPADAPGGSQPAHSDSLAQPATPRRPLAKPLAARTPRSGTPSVHSSHRPRPAVSAAALAAVVQLPEMPAAAAGSSVQPFDTKPAASGGFGPPPPPQQHSSPRKIPSPQKRVRPPVAPRPRPSSYAVIAQHRPEPVAAASAGLPPPRQPPQQEAPAAATDGARPPAGPLEVDSTHHRRPQAGLAEPMAPGLSHMPAACSSDAGSASPRSDASAASSERQRPQPDAAPAAATGYAAKAAAKAAARAAAEAAAQQRRQAAIAARKVAAAAAAAEAERAAADAEALLAPAPEEMSYDLAAGTAAETAAAEPCEPRFSSALGAGTSQPLPKGHYSAVQLLATCGSDAMVAAAAAAASQPVVGEWTFCSVL